MAEVIRPNRQENSLNSLLTVGGGVIGAAYGGGLGAALTGAGAGQMAGGLLNGQKSPQQNIPLNSQASAMARRQQSMSQDNLATLKQAEATLPQLPESLRQQYAPAIVQARMLEQQKRGIV